MSLCIVDDVIPENPECFHITVERPSDVDTRITVDPAAGVVTILDDDGMWHMICSMKVMIISELHTIF